MAEVGYVRVSSENQNTDRQLNNVVLDKVFSEKQSAKCVDERVELQNCIDYIRQGDTLHIHSIDRLARNLEDLQTLIKLITHKGVVVKFHQEGLVFSSDGSNPMSILMMQMIGAFAQFERTLIKERQQQGIQKALQKGIRFGATPKFTAEQIAEIKAKRQLGVSAAKLAIEFNVSRQTIYSMLQK